MLFNSFEFLLFFPAVLAVYYAAPRVTRIFVLLVASYAFYMAWRPELILLIAGSTLVDYVAARNIGATESRSRRRAWLTLSLSVNLGLLFLFKYAGFATREANELLEALGVAGRVPVLDLPLPVGISFYTFQTLSYTINVFFRRATVERNAGAFALYVAYFPQLVAGPIERSGRLLPQLKDLPPLDAQRCVSGLRLALWGMFKKVVIADRLAVLVDLVYGSPGAYTDEALGLATIFFAFQIYCDFSGYSDIAIGISRVIGVDLMTNFRRPYLALGVRDFWRRWHISLSTWFRDYLYIPLGGSQLPLVRWALVVLFVFLVSGLWHGANWTFVVWGGIHGTLLVLEGLVGDRARTWAEKLPMAGGLLRGLMRPATFLVVLVAWVFFRAESVSDGFLIVERMAHVPYEALLGEGASLAWLETDAKRLGLAGFELGLAVVAILGLVAAELVRELRGRPWNPPTWLQWSADYAGLLGILVLGRFSENAFIYFQF